jgi:hypothetical protein
MYPPLSTTNPAWDRQGSPRGRPPMVLMDERLDVVLIHDAIDGVLSDAELEAALETASLHRAPGGLAVFVPRTTSVASRGACHG